MVNDAQEYGLIFIFAIPRRLTSDKEELRECGLRIASSNSSNRQLVNLSEKLNENKKC